MPSLPHEENALDEYNPFIYTQAYKKTLKDGSKLISLILVIPLIRKKGRSSKRGSSLPVIKKIFRVQSIKTLKSPRYPMSLMVMTQYWEAQTTPGLFIYFRNIVRMIRI